MLTAGANGCPSSSDTNWTTIFAAGLGGSGSGSGTPWYTLTRLGGGSKVAIFSSQALDSATPISTEDHLSYPTLSDEDILEASTSKIQQPRQTLQDRLYVGNLHPGVDEYSLLQIFSKFGKVTKFDFLFHKTGLLKGKPRGYAFVEYGSKDDALKAMSAVHDKLLRGRKLVVTFAQQAPIDPGLGPSSLKRKAMTESGRPTTLSMIKSGMGNRHEGMEDKIAMMEAKLRQMERSKSNPNDHGSLPYHASLPPKPLPSNSTLTRETSSFRTTQNEPQRMRKPAPALPSLPLIPQPAFEFHNSKGLSGTSRPANSASRKNAAFVGVKLKKAKEKDEAVSRPTDDAR
ncbi:hypothetical protein GGX14DRAFT_652921 [Mycena pura]|uniref:Probable RNA-binding protein 18 n=1 Tax=Mycena pura TaxID=153505 RepID=A0AAD6Y5P4_9AGAR|nr:hypothetical protein GGX14DRAFT_652921 [Mycena pura]